MSVLHQPLRLETGEWVDLISSRTMLSRLWFVNNEPLANAILGYLAKYQELYGVVIYAFIIMGNHYHLVAKFPNKNRAKFMRSFNSIIQKLVKRYVPGFEGGTLWSRRYSAEVLPNNEDVEHWTLYSWLNPVSSGLTMRITDYQSYNSFFDSARGIKRKFKTIDWTDYNNRKRCNPHLSIKECTKEHLLEFSVLPGCADMIPEEYNKYLLGKLESRRVELIKKRTDDGLGFAGPEVLKHTRAGSKPRSTKTSTRNSIRPIVLTLCDETRKRFRDWFFQLLASYQEASRRFRAGEYDVVFPPGTYRPPLFTVTI
jgi:REP element-mobilizing transposase RayT